MDEPKYYRGTIDYPKGNDVKVVEFYYPTHTRWSCIHCGDCCMDVDNRTRMILLLPEDIIRIQSTGAMDFFEDWDENHFTGIMCKNEGKCVFYTGESCSIYEQRALLCRMYPFWLEKQDNYFLFGIDNECSGANKGELLGEDFFKKLLRIALEAMDY